jgi:hypothetical protein
MSMTLKLSSRMSSSDPIEKYEPFISAGGYFDADTDSDKEFNTHRSDIDSIREHLKKSWKLTKQASFCRNNFSLIPKGIADVPLEFFGFLNQRAWDRYADNYKGCSLIFSKKKILKNESLKGSEIQYKLFNSLKVHNRRIDINDLKTIGVETYSDQLFHRDLNRMFLKHKDYESEAEYRIICQSEEDEVFINIKNSLEAIVINSNYMGHNRQKVEQIARKLSIPLIEISWGMRTPKVRINNQDVTHLLTAKMENWP